MPHDRIHFSWNGMNYTAPMEFYHMKRVVLPDATLLEVEDGWLESMPPQPRSLKEITYTYPKDELDMIALENKAVIADIV